MCGVFHLTKVLLISNFVLVKNAKFFKETNFGENICKIKDYELY